MEAPRYDIADARPVPVAIDRRSGPSDVIQMQPLPRKTSVNYLRVGSEIVTSIHRQWHEGDSGPRGICRRCPSCTADPDGACHMQVRRYIPRDQAASFAVVDFANPVWKGL